jgi:hypothetical protein
VTFLLIVYERKGTSGGGNSPRSSVEMGKKQTVYTCLHSYTHICWMVLQSLYHVHVCVLLDCCISLTNAVLWLLATFMPFIEASWGEMSCS